MGRQPLISLANVRAEVRLGGQPQKGHLTIDVASVDCPCELRDNRKINPPLSRPFAVAPLLTEGRRFSSWHVWGKSAHVETLYVPDCHNMTSRQAPQTVIGSQIVKASVAQIALQLLFNHARVGGQRLQIRVASCQGAPVNAGLY